MHGVDDNEGSHNSVISNRTMNIAVALALMIVASVVMIASYRLGAGWSKDVGPDSGYFPFYVALVPSDLQYRHDVAARLCATGRRGRQLHRAP